VKTTHQIPKKYYFAPQTTVTGELLPVTLKEAFAEVCKAKKTTVIIIETVPTVIVRVPPVWVLVNLHYGWNSPFYLFLSMNIWDWNVNL
jgi:hypothetical protein